LRLENAPRIIELLKRMRGIKDALASELARLAGEYAREKAPVRSGRLKRSISVRRTRCGYEVCMGGSEAPYAGYVEYGTRPHLIRARRARALRFELDGDLVYVRYVRHPGTRPGLIMASAMAEASRNLDKIIDRVLRML